jgi:hypothetical protein
MTEEISETTVSRISARNVMTEEISETTVSRISARNVMTEEISEFIILTHLRNIF